MAAKRCEETGQVSQPDGWGRSSKTGQRDREETRGNRAERTVPQRRDNSEQAGVPGVPIVVDADGVNVKDPSGLSGFDAERGEREDGGAGRKGEDATRERGRRVRSEGVWMTERT